jgi:hypothetical protein
VGKRSYVARRVVDVLVFVHTAESPTDEEWEELLEYYRKASELPEYKTLVLSIGGAPNAGQRVRLSEIIGEKPTRIAVLTPSPLVRAAGIAVSWFRPNIRMFNPTDVRAALEHLGVPDAELRIRRALDELKAELGVT